MIIHQDHQYSEQNGLAHHQEPHADPRAAAFYYARIGIPVFPCKLDKRPYTRHGHKDATTDATQIAAWWERWPDANIGIPTGKASGMLVLDVDLDPDDGGLESWHALFSAHGFPPTLCVKTGGDGFHMVFLYPKRQRLPSSVGKLGPGLDVRGEGGYFIAPPGYTTGPYTPLNRTQMADVPDWLLEILKKKPRPSAGKSGDVHPAVSASTAGPPIRKRTRNDTLASIAGRLHDGSRTLEQLAADLDAINQTRCQPPLSTKEVQKIARSVYRYERSTSAASAPGEVGDFASRHRAQVLQGRAWPGRSGPTDHDGYEALLDLAEQHGQLLESGNVVVSVSIRDFAMRAGMHEDTARKGCLPRLQKAHLIYRDPTFTGPNKAGVIVLRNVTTQATPIQPTTLVSGNAAGDSGEEEWVNAGLLRTLLRRTRHGGKLSKGDALVLRGLMREGGEATPLEIRDRLGRGRGCDIRRSLRKLEGQDVVRCVGGNTRDGTDRWRVADDLMAAYESALGNDIKEREEKQRFRNDQQRKKYADRLE